MPCTRFTIIKYYTMIKPFQWFVLHTGKPVTPPSSGPLIEATFRITFSKYQPSVGMMDWNFVYWRYPGTLLIPIFDVPTWPERKCNKYVYDTTLHPSDPRDIILTRLVLVHAGYLLCNWNPLNASYHWTTFDGIPGSFNSSQIVWIEVLESRFKVSSEWRGLHKMLPRRRFEPSTSCMPGKHRTPRPWLPRQMIF